MASKPLIAPPSNTGVKRSYVDTIRLSGPHQVGRTLNSTTRVVVTALRVQSRDSLPQELGGSPSATGRYSGVATGVRLVEPGAARSRMIACAEPIRYRGGTVRMSMPTSDLGLDATTHLAIAGRLNELRDIASDEEIGWKAAAEKQFWALLNLLERPSRPAIAIDDNGDLRALWSNLINEQVGVRFTGGAAVSGVLFSKTEHGMLRETLNSQIEIVVARIRQLKLVSVTQG